MVRLAVINRVRDGSPAANDPPGVAALVFDEVSLVRQGRPVLEDLSFTLPAGQLIAVIGGNGAGKSALLKAIVESPRLDQGTIRVYGHDPADPLARRCIASLPDPSQTDRWLQAHSRSNPHPHAHSHPHPHPHPTPHSLRMKGGRGVDLLVWLAGQVGLQWTPDEASEQAAALRLERAWLDEEAQRLSPGSVRVLGLTAALACDRDLLLLDEPFAGLDAPSQARWAEYLGQRAQGRRSVLVASRSLGDIGTRADRVLVLADGCLAFTGVPAALGGAGTQGVRGPVGRAARAAE